MSGGSRHQGCIFSSHRSEDSTRCGNIGGLSSFQNVTVITDRDFDYDELAPAVLSGISSPRKNPPIILRLHNK